MIFISMFLAYNRLYCKYNFRSLVRVLHIYIWRGGTSKPLESDFRARKFYKWKLELEGKRRKRKEDEEEKKDNEFFFFLIKDHTDYLARKKQESVNVSIWK